jgi:[ribosomal protein S5]-alanine N-acetyltransferase
MPIQPRRTERLLLREISVDDAAALARIQSDPEVARYQSYEPRSVEQAATYIATCLADGALEPRRLWELAIDRADTGQFVGRVGCTLDAPGHEASIWYEIDPACWRVGFATEAAHSLLALLFDEVGVHRVIADIDPRNAGSARVAERLGMRREAHFLENALIRGVWVDTWIYGLLRREWQARPRR